jgi:ferredoxin
MTFDCMEYELDARGRITAERLTGEEFIPADDVILAIGQENAFPWIEGDLGIDFDKWHVPKVDPVTFQSTRPGVFFGGDAAFGPKNIIWAVEHGHQAAISIHQHCQGEPVTERLAPGVNLQSRKMGMHEWSYSNDYTPVERRLMPHVSLKERFKKLNIEVELGFTAEQAAQEVQRCLNCDVQTVFTAKLCIECDACLDICPVDCLTMTANGPEAELRGRLKVAARNLTQPLYVSGPLPQTARVMVKDEDLCVHCGLCAERCPTAAWDMQKSNVHWPHAGDEAGVPEARTSRVRPALPKIA